jgi:hypothetical protein
MAISILLKNFFGMWGIIESGRFSRGPSLKQPANLNNDSITIYTPKDRSACGVKMKLNERWQIWAEYASFFSDDDISRWLTVINCGRSTKNLKRHDSLIHKWSIMLSTTKN